MKHDLNYYMALDYKIEILPIPEDQGGGYMARIPQFGELGIIGDGETKEEALVNMEQYKRDTFERYLAEGKSIPEPEEDLFENFSGKFVLRVPKYMHRQLALSAKENGVSLNALVNNLLSSSLKEFGRHL
jgi:predicted HicB family RNase H-like nuclease